MPALLAAEPGFVAESSRFDLGLGGSLAFFGSGAGSVAVGNSRFPIGGATYWNTPQAAKQNNKRTKDGFIKRLQPITNVLGGR